MEGSIILPLILDSHRIPLQLILIPHLDTLRKASGIETGHGCLCVSVNLDSLRIAIVPIRNLTVLSSILLPIRGIETR
jgi:hypothetical protein